MIITFYSYKGGVGRSQLCANVASYLCHRKGKRVLLMDWDFEAPGLHYFFNKSNSDLSCDGTIELLIRYRRLMRTKAIVNEADYKYFDVDSFVNLTASKDGAGKIDIIPAGNYDDSYVAKVNDFDWYEFYSLLDGTAYIESLKSWLKNLQYDFIFIDSRTGINDYSGICNIQLPDANVVVMAANRQNLDGCKRVIDQIIGSEYTQRGFRKSYIFPILSRINVNHFQYGYWSEMFCDSFHQLLHQLDRAAVPDFSREIFKDFYLDKTLLADESQYSAGENLLINSGVTALPKNSFVSKYANLAEYIVKVSNEGSISIDDQIDAETWLGWAELAASQENRVKAAMAYAKGGDIDNSLFFGGTTSVHFGLAVENFAKGENELAIDHYIAAIKMAPNNSDAHYNLGNVYNAIGAYDLAIKSYEGAIELDKTIVEAYLNMGNSYFSMRQYSSARKCYLKANEIRPNDYKTCYNLGNTCLSLDENHEAIEWFREAHELNPTKADICANWGYAYLTIGDLESAEAKLNEAIKLGDVEMANMNLGHIFLIKGDLEMATSFYYESYRSYSIQNRESFYKSMVDDFKVLAQFGINREDYELIKHMIEDIE